MGLLAAAVIVRGFGPLVRLLSVRIPCLNSIHCDIGSSFLRPTRLIYQNLDWGVGLSSAFEVIVNLLFFILHPQFLIFCLIFNWTIWSLFALYQVTYIRLRLHLIFWRKNVDFRLLILKALLHNFPLDCPQIL